MKKKHLSSFRLIFLGFVGVILIGALLLMLPFSSSTGGVTPFLNALFTSTSAVCVTGLVVYDTATYWSLFGQTVILLLIQIGGLGVVTIAVFGAMLSGRKIGLIQKSTMMDSISAPNIGGIAKLVGFILKITFVIELIGAVLFMPVLVRDFGARGIWMSCFQSISAFCNAGFDLMGTREQFSSLTSYYAQPLVNIVTMALIIIGGIGFLVWDDIKTNKHRFKRYRMQTKAVLSTTAVLLILPFIYFFFAEFDGYKMGERILLSAFQAVTPRTAGFNTANLNALSDTGQVVTMLLMLIGGSPGSTAGGMKTTTVAVLVFAAISVFKRKNDIECFGRRINDSVVKNAATILLLYITFFAFAGVVISNVENLSMLDCLYETASAIGTVGLTLGITTKLSAISKLILISLMFFGRVGGLTIIFAALSSNANVNISRKPEEKITVG